MLKLLARGSVLLLVAIGLGIAEGMECSSHAQTKSVLLLFEFLLEMDLV